MSIGAVLGEGEGEGEEGEMDSEEAEYRLTPKSNWLKKPRRLLSSGESHSNLDPCVLEAIAITL